MTRPEETKVTDWYPIAAAYRWANPDVTWDDVAKYVGKTRQHFWRIRKTYAWEIAYREAGHEYVQAMAHHAAGALVKAWKKGNPTSAMDTLRSLGFVAPEQLDINDKSRDLDAEVMALVEKLSAPR